ncbi:YicC family protein [Intestinibacillus massiliensis]|nr:YicC family protein [Intestinibacillus massiliensis]
MKSMTGYGRARATLSDREITVELRAVNHRYFDCTVKAPRMYGFLEDPVKKAAGQRIARGKVDIFVSVNAVGGADTRIVLNDKVAEGYLEALTALRDRFGLRDDISVMSIAKLPDVLTAEKEEEDIEALKKDVLTVLGQAADEFDVMRGREGRKMAADVSGRMETILGLVAQVEERSPQCVQEYREKLEKRMREVLADSSIDPQRILTEAALFADKTAVDEETVRLRSHVHQLGLMLEEDAPVGRKLDFLVQEMNRESNTIGSKANDVQLANIVVSLKAEIEKIREQIQNIE